MSQTVFWHFVYYMCLADLNTPICLSILVYTRSSLASFAHSFNLCVNSNTPRGLAGIKECAMIGRHMHVHATNTIAHSSPGTHANALHLVRAHAWQN